MVSTQVVKLAEEMLMSTENDMINPTFASFSCYSDHFMLFISICQKKGIQMNISMLLFHMLHTSPMLLDGSFCY